jgi:hypothetical protein
MPIPHLTHDQIVGVSVLAGLFVLGLVIKWIRGREAPFPYEPADALLTAAERSFYLVLVNAIGEDFGLFIKVRLADVIAVRPGVSSKHRLGAFSRISSKHLDFVLCDPETFAVLGAIELDDRSHRANNRRQRDAFIDGALRAAGIPILHVPAQRSYSATKLRVQILDFLENPGPTIADRH